MTDEIRNILCPELAIDDGEAGLLLRSAVKEYPDAWSAFMYILNHYGMEAACDYLRCTPHSTLQRLVIVMPRLLNELEKEINPQATPTIAPSAKSVTIALQGGTVHQGEVKEVPYLPDSIKKLE